MKIHTLLLVGLSFLLTLHQVSAQSGLRQGKDYALFFAINDYDEWDDLQWPAREVATISKELSENYGFRIETVRNPTLAVIAQKLEEYRDRKYAGDSQLFIYFSGHGYFSEKTKEGFFVPKEGKRSDKSQGSYWPFVRMEKAVTSIPCPHIVLALDACYSGTFDDAVAMRGEPGGLPWASRQGTKWDAYIQEALQPKSRLVLTSSEKERTPDQSIFAQKILEALQSNAAHRDVLSFEALAYDVKVITPKPHSAHFEGHEDNGTFLFFPKGFEGTPVPAVKKTGTGTEGSQPKPAEINRPVSEQPNVEGEKAGPTKKEKRGKKVLDTVVDILTAPNVASGSIETAHLNEYVFALKSCTKDGNNIVFYFDVKSENKDRKLVLYGKESPIRDENGNKFYPSGIKLSNTYHVSKVSEKLVANVTHPVTVTYRDITTEPRTITLMELNVWTEDSGYQTLKFRNVPVSE